MESFDNIKKPKHYQLSGLGIEVKDIIFEVTKDLKGKEAVCVGNILKYVFEPNIRMGLRTTKKRWNI